MFAGIARRRAYGKLHRAARDKLRLAMRRQVDRERRFLFEHRLPVADVFPIENALPRRFTTDAGVPGQQDHAQLVFSCAQRQAFSRLQAVGGEVHVFQRTGCQRYDVAASGFALGQQIHDSFLLIVHRPAAGATCHSPFWRTHSSALRRGPVRPRPPASRCNRPATRP